MILMQHIPDHVKRQAMDAVAHRETTDYMRRFRPEDASHESLSQSFSAHNQAKEQRSKPIPDHVKRQAMNAIKHRETSSQISLMKDNGIIFAPTTPSREAQIAAQRVTDLHRKGLEVDRVHNEITRDDF